MTPGIKYVHVRDNTGVPTVQNVPNKCWMRGHALHNSLLMKMMSNTDRGWSLMHTMCVDSVGINDIQVGKDNAVHMQSRTIILAFTTSCVNCSPIPYGLNIISKTWRWCRFSAAVSC